MGILKGYVLGSIIGTPAMPFSRDHTRFELFKLLVRGGTKTLQAKEARQKTSAPDSGNAKGKSIIPNAQTKR